MLSSVERRRLLKVIDVEPINAWMVLAKCAAGLVVIVLVAAVGFSQPADRGTSLAAAAVAVPVTGRFDQSAQEHRKQVFDERRQRFQGNAARHSVASEAVEPSNQMSAILR